MALVIGVAHAGRNPRIVPDAVGALGVTGIGLVRLAIVRPVRHGDGLGGAGSRRRCRRRAAILGQERIEQAAVIGASFVEIEQPARPFQFAIQRLAVDGELGLVGLIFGEVIDIGVGFEGLAAADCRAGIVPGAIGAHQLHVQIVTERLVRGGGPGLIVADADIAARLFGAPESVGLLARIGIDQGVIGGGRRIDVADAGGGRRLVIGRNGAPLQVHETNAGTGNVADRGLAARRRRTDERAQIVIARTGVMFRRDIGADHQAEAVIGLPFDAEQAGQLVAAEGGLMVAGAGGRVAEIVGDIAFLVVGIQRDARRQRVGQRNIDGALQAGAAIIAQSAADIATEIGARILGIIKNGAAGGIAADQGALRPLQHFDIVHVEQRTGQAHSARVINAILVDGGCGIEAQARIAAARRRVEIALAANGDVEGILAEGGGCDIDRRCGIFQIFERLDAQPVEIVLGIGGDRNRDRLRIFLYLARGDDHRLKPDARRGIVALCHCRHGAHQGENARRKHRYFAHKSPPELFLLQAM